MGARRKAAKPKAQRPHWNDLSPRHMTVAVSGPPGSGKSTLLKTLAGALDGDTLGRVQLLETVAAVEVPDADRKPTVWRGFKIGDVVTLKSGGLRMTLLHWCEGRAVCAWSLDGDIRMEHLPVAALKLAELDDDEIPF